MPKPPATKTSSPYLAAVLHRLADRVRAKSNSIRDWGWDPSASDEARASAAALDEAKEVARGALNDVADALDEEAKAIEEAETLGQENKR